MQDLVTELQVARIVQWMLRPAAVALWLGTLIVPLRTQPAPPPPAPAQIKPAQIKDVQIPKLTPPPRLARRPPPHRRLPPAPTRRRRARQPQNLRLDRLRRAELLRRLRLRRAARPNARPLGQARGHLQRRPGRRLLRYLPLRPAWVRILRQSPRRAGEYRSLADRVQNERSCPDRRIPPGGCLRAVRQTRQAPHRSHVRSPCLLL